jgi:serine/threonine-protein kinase
VALTPMPEHKSRPVEEHPADILPILRQSGILPERQFEDVRERVLRGDYPYDSKELAQRLIREGVLTEYQARRILSNKPHGMVVGRYVIMDRLGSGAMGRVYKAHHQLMDRIVALKIIAPEIVTNGRVVARFQREMKMVGRLDHPNVVRAYDADQLGQTLYIVMEYVQGKSLSQKFKREGAIPAQDVVNYAAQAALGLAHAHAQSIVHRDVKPSNLLLSDTGQVKVLDLGLGVLMEADEASSFATADGIAVGTIDYMSPEQACGKEVDGRSDIYSLGCAMYHLISGRLPFPGNSPVERLGKRISGRPVPIHEVKPDLPQAFLQVFERMLAARPSERFQTATEAAEALQALVRPKAAPRKIPVARPATSAAAPPSPPDGNASVPVAQPLLGSPPPSQVAAEDRPAFPRWFGPLASLAETSPSGALATLIAILLAAYGAGIVTALAIR